MANNKAYPPVLYAQTGTDVYFEISNKISAETQAKHSPFSQLVPQCQHVMGSVCMKNNVLQICIKNNVRQTIKFMKILPCIHTQNIVQLP